MSINIPSDVCKVARSILVTVNTTNLGPRQRTGMLRAVRTGVILGGSLPFRLALSVLKNNMLPYIYIRGGRLEWNNVDRGEDSFYSSLHIIVATWALDGADTQGYYQQKRDSMHRAATDKCREFAEWVGNDISKTKKLLRRVKFKRVMPSTYVIPETFTYDALVGERL